jgi:hypothetical protein
VADKDLDIVKLKQVELELAKVELEIQKQHIEMQKVRNERLHKFLNEGGLPTLGLSLAAILVFGAFCFGCYQNTQFDKTLLEKGYYSTGPGMPPTPLPVPTIPEKR